MQDERIPICNLEVQVEDDAFKDNYVVILKLQIADCYDPDLPYGGYHSTGTKFEKLGGFLSKYYFYKAPVDAVSTLVNGLTKLLVGKFRCSHPIAMDEYYYWYDRIGRMLVKLLPGNVKFTTENVLKPLPTYPYPAPSVSFYGKQPNVLAKVRNTLPALNNHVAHPDPDPGSSSYRQPTPLWEVIVNLNDKRGWSRERIADWLETLDLELSFPTEVIKSDRS